jgi:hypothetical protein
MAKSVFAVVILFVPIVTVAMAVPAAAQKGSYRACYSIRCQVHHECPKQCK